VLRGELQRRAVGPAEHHRHVELPARHVEHLGGDVHHLVDRQQAKFQVMNSMIGRSPTIAAPTPTPAKPSSVIGVSTTRISPNSCRSPFDTLYAPL
jgi:hypothetical protein